MLEKLGVGFFVVVLFVLVNICQLECTLRMLVKK